MHKIRTAVATLIAAVTIAAGVGIMVGSTAQATLLARSGTITDKDLIITDNTARLMSAPAAAANWVTIPGMTRTVVLTGTRTLVADYTAESRCHGASGYASVRIVLVRLTGPLQELDPVAGTDFAFDSCAGNDLWEAHAIKRSSPWLTASTCQIWVQARLVGAATALRVDEQALEVRAVRP